MADGERERIQVRLGKGSPFTIRLPVGDQALDDDDLQVALRSLQENSGLSLSEIVRTSLRLYLGQPEGRVALAEALMRTDAVAKRFTALFFGELRAATDRAVEQLATELGGD